MNQFNKMFFKAQSFLAKNAGQVCEYKQGQLIISNIPCVQGSKNMQGYDPQNGNVLISYTQSYFAIDGKYLIDEDEIAIRPKRNDIITCGGIEFQVMQNNGNYFQSSIPNNGQFGLLRINVIQKTKGKQ